VIYLLTLVLKHATNLIQTRCATFDQSMTKKIGILILTIILTPILAGIYGILHDQISYSISPEYFTKFKFAQFEFGFMAQNQPRLTASVVGFFSTWWTGLIIGIILSIIGLTFPNYKTMWKSIKIATIRTLGIALGIGLIGIVVGKLIISEIDGNWIIPDTVTNKKAFLTVGTMHTFSYIGGLIGLIFGVIYQLRLKKDIK